MGWPVDQAQLGHKEYGSQLQPKASVKVFGVLILYSISLATGAFEKAKLQNHKEEKGRGNPRRYFNGSTIPLRPAGSGRNQLVTSQSNPLAQRCST